MGLSWGEAEAQKNEHGLVTDLTAAM